MDEEDKIDMARSDPRRWARGEVYIDNPDRCEICGQEFLTYEMFRHHMLM